MCVHVFVVMYIMHINKGGGRGYFRTVIESTFGGKIPIHKKGQ